MVWQAAIDCAIPDGHYKFHIEEIKDIYLGIVGKNRLGIKFRFSSKDQDVWTVGRKGLREDNVYSFVMTHNGQLKSCSMIPTPSSAGDICPVLTKTHEQEFTAWCGSNGRTYLQIMNGNQWIKKRNIASKYGIFFNASNICHIHSVEVMSALASLPQ